MADFKVQNPDFETRSREIFGSQTVMTMIGAQITHIAPGEVHIELPYRADLAQQNGFVHAGIITAIVDTACGCAAFTLMPPGSDVLTVEFKVNLLSPAVGERFIARAQVLKPGQTVTVCTGNVYALRDGVEKIVATMLATLIQRKAT